eukprot:752045-Heterocapsa_arctica.AAC.1
MPAANWSALPMEPMKISASRGDAEVEEDGGDAAACEDAAGGEAPGAARSGGPPRDGGVHGFHGRRPEPAGAAAHGSFSKTGSMMPLVQAPCGDGGARAAVRHAEMAGRRPRAAARAPGASPHKAARAEH